MDKNEPWLSLVKSIRVNYLNRDQGSVNINFLIAVVNTIQVLHEHRKSCKHGSDYYANKLISFGRIEVSSDDLGTVDARVTHTIDYLRKNKVYEGGQAAALIEGAVVLLRDEEYDDLNILLASRRDILERMAGGDI